MGNCLTTSTPPGEPVPLGPWQPRNCAPEITQARLKGVIDEQRPTAPTIYSIFEAPKNFSASIAGDGTITLKPHRAYDNMRDGFVIAIQQPPRPDGSYQIDRIRVDLSLSSCGSAQIGTNKELATKPFAGPGSAAAGERAQEEARRAAEPAAAGSKK